MIIGSKVPPQIAATYGSGPSGVAKPGPQGARKAGGGRNDQVTLSDEGRELFQLVGKLRELSDVRADRVAYLKGLVAEGKYSPNTLALAERLVENGGL
jgi:flagellar biosynthesis anti-sigma factor FlgM